MRSKQRLRGMGHVFSFTLGQMIKSRANLVSAAILLLLVLLSVPLSQLIRQDASSDFTPPAAQEQALPADLTPQQQEILSSPIYVTSDNAGEAEADDGMGSFFLQYGYAIAVMVLSMMSTAFILRSIVEEKESRLVELLMVSVTPLALVAGKILAVMVYLLILLALALVCLALSFVLTGVFLGTDAAWSTLHLLRSYLQEGSGSGVHPAQAALVVLLSLLLAYLTLSVVGGIAGACCGSIDDVGSANGSVMLIVMACYFVTCVVGAIPSTGLAVFSSLCPVLSLFCAPVQWICGNIPFWVLLLSWLLQLAVIAGLLRLCARVYRELILRRGSRVKLKELLAMTKGGARV